SAATTAFWHYKDQQYQINLIDTPGHVDFTVEVERSLRVLDGAIATFCAVGGVEPQSETVWRQADKYNVPRLGYVNKMDRTGADFLSVCAQIKKHFGSTALPVVLPIGAEDKFEGLVDLIYNNAIYYNDDKTARDNFVIKEIPASMQEEAAEWRAKLIEEVASTNDALMEKFFEDPNSITAEELIAAIRVATISMKIVPMLCGSSFHNKGVQKLLDYSIAFLPSPMDIPAVTGINPKTDKEETRKPSDEDPFCGLAFKIATDPFVGRLAFVRIYSGHLDAGSYVLNSRSGKRERISRIYQMHANKQNPMETIGAGDICAAVGFKEIHTGDTLCAENAPIVLEQMTFPEPVIGLAVEPKTQKDLDKLGIALAKLSEEDPTFTVHTDEDSGQTVISGMGELHLDIIVDRLRREFGVEISQGAPQVNYKETLTKTVQHREVFKKQTGGRGKFADISFEIGPAEEGKMGLTFVDEVKGGNIPKEFIPAIQKGFASAMSNGALAGYTMDSMKITLKDGSFHPVDSDQLSFEICARSAYRAAAPKAGSVIMEPIMDVEVVTPEENMGDIIGDLNKRRGQITGMESKGTARVVKAKVPLSEMFGYVTVLRTISSGRATSSMEFSHYEEVPMNLAKDIIEKASGKTKELE
ncbi:MAG: elongation factor G, partial [Alistipes sp.]